MKANHGVGNKSQLYVAAKIYLKIIPLNPKIVFDFHLALETLSCFSQMDVSLIFPLLLFLQLAFLLSKIYIKR